MSTRNGKATKSLRLKYCSARSRGASIEWRPNQKQIDELVLERLGALDTHWNVRAIVVEMFSHSARLEIVSPNHPAQGRTACLRFDYIPRSHLPLMVGQIISADIMGAWPQPPSRRGGSWLHIAMSLMHLNSRQRYGNYQRVSGTVVGLSPAAASVRLDDHDVLGFLRRDKLNGLPPNQLRLGLKLPKMRVSEDEPDRRILLTMLKP
jgi:hypothetical protein